MNSLALVRAAGIADSGRTVDACPDIPMGASAIGPSAGPWPTPSLPARACRSAALVDVRAEALSDQSLPRARATTRRTPSSAPGLFAAVILVKGGCEQHGMGARGERDPAEDRRERTAFDGDGQSGCRVMIHRLHPEVDSPVPLRLPSHHRMSRQRCFEVGGFVLPSRVPCIQLHMLADVHGRQKSEQQKQSQGHGVWILASTMDADAPQREDGREDQRNQHVARHREYRRPSPGRPAYRHVAVTGAKPPGIDVRDRLQHPEPCGQPIAPVPEPAIVGRA